MPVRKRSKVKTIHLVSEAAALIVIAPWLFKMANNPKIHKQDRQIASFFGWATVIIDGGLLIAGLNHKKKGL